MATPSRTAPAADYEISALTATRLAGYSDFRVTTAPARATKGKLVFKLAMGRTLTVTKQFKRWAWVETSPSGTYKGTVSAGLANLARMLS